MADKLQIVLTSQTLVNGAMRGEGSRLAEVDSFGATGAELASLIAQGLATIQAPTASAAADPGSASFGDEE